MKAVEVIWEDSQRMEDGWLYKDNDDDLKAFVESEPVTVRSVGMLYRETEHALVLVQCDSHEQVLNGIKIPRRCVKELREL